MVAGSEATTHVVRCKQCPALEKSLTSDGDCWFRSDRHGLIMERVRGSSNGCRFFLFPFGPPHTALDQLHSALDVGYKLGSA